MRMVLQWKLKETKMENKPNKLRALVYADKQRLKMFNWNIFWPCLPVFRSKKIECKLEDRFPGATVSPKLNTSGLKVSQFRPFPFRPNNLQSILCDSSENNRPIYKSLTFHHLTSSLHIPVLTSLIMKTSVTCPLILHSFKPHFFPTNIQGSCAISDLGAPKWAHRSDVSHFPYCPCRKCSF